MGHDTRAVAGEWGPQIWATWWLALWTIFTRSTVPLFLGSFHPFSWFLTKMDLFTISDLVTISENEIKSCFLLVLPCPECWIRADLLRCDLWLHLDLGIFGLEVLPVSSCCDSTALRQHHKSLLVFYIPFWHLLVSSCPIGFIKNIYVVFLILPAISFMSFFFHGQIVKSREQSSPHLPGCNVIKVVQPYH